MFARAKMRRWAANVALLLVSTVAALAVLEGVARVARLQRGSGKRDGTLGLYREYDPVLGWRKRPGAQVTFRRQEYDVTVAINRLGLRDPEREYATPPNGFRILALGDSFVEGYGVPLPSTVTQVLEGTLRSAGCAVEVINGATAAYSTDQEYLFYREEGVRYSPRVVLLFFYYNDVLFNTRASYYGSPKPLLLFRGDEPRLGRPVPNPSVPPAQAEGPAGAPEPEGSALLEWVEDRLTRGAPAAYNALAGLGLWTRIRAVPPPLELKVYRTKRLPEIEEAWEMTGRLVAAMAHLAARHGARLLAVYTPSRMEVSDRDWELTRLRYGMDDRWDRGLVVRRLRQIGSATGVAVLDLTPGLRRVDRGLLGGPYYVYDGHWNALGHRTAAQEVHRFLSEQGWLPGCAGKP